MSSFRDGRFGTAGRIESAHGKGLPPQRYDREVAPMMASETGQ